MGDLRKPSGIFFLILGVILTAYAVLTGARAPLTDYDLNLYTGLVMLGFGGTLLWLAQRAN